MEANTRIPDFVLCKATDADIPLILSFIYALAKYEKLAHEVVATEDVLRESLFGNRKVAEVIIGYFRDEPVSFALFFHNFSTFLCRPGIFLEDLYVKPEYRGKGFGKSMLAYLAHLARDRNCGRLEWWVLDWNASAVEFYRSIGAIPMENWTLQRLSGKALQDLSDTF